MQDPRLIRLVAVRAGTGAQAGVVRGGAAGGGAGVGEGLAGAGDDRRDEPYGERGVRRMVSSSTPVAVL